MLYGMLTWMKESRHLGNNESLESTTISRIGRVKNV